MRLLFALHEIRTENLRADGFLESFKIAGAVGFAVDRTPLAGETAELRFVRLVRAGSLNVGNRVGAVCERSARVGGKLRRLKREFCINQRRFLTLLVLAGNPDFVGEALETLRLLELQRPFQPPSAHGAFRR